MIIQLDSATAEDTDNARQDLGALTNSWGVELTDAPAPTPNVTRPPRDDDKVIDPISLTALALSIPSAALAVLDLADRIQKRRRATELIDQAQQMASSGNVTVSVVSEDGPVVLSTLTPDQLLDLLAEESQTS